MNFAFSTLGCPSWSFDEIVSTASDLHYDGIEIRGVANELFAPNIKAFSAENIGATVEKLKRLNLKITMLTSGASLAVYATKDSALSEAKAYIDLAAKLSVPYIRVMCTNKPEPDGGDVVLCRKLYKEICDYAKGTGVLPLMETNGIFADTAYLYEFLDKVGDGGALWDINHPFRFNGESIKQTIDNLGSKIKYVHIKDSVVLNGQTKYKMLGYGDIPINEALSILKDVGYDGTISLEWVKRWNQELEEPGIVFSHFISTIKRYLKIGKSKNLPRKNIIRQLSNSVVFRRDLFILSKT
jgi:Sugar phosphate isomerases/epimerases